jgi:hypothetical protein
MYIGLQVKYPLFLADFNENLNFLGIFFKNNQISNFIKIRLVGAEFFRADRKNMTKLITIFRNFANAPKNKSFVTEKYRRNTVLYGKWFETHDEKNIWIPQRGRWRRLEKIQ